MANSITLENTKSLIVKQTFFSQLTNEEIDILASLMVEKSFSPGEVIVSEGDTVDSIYILASGTTDVTRVKYENQQPHVEHLATLNAGDTIGLNETGFYSLSGKRTATVIATSAVTALRLSVAEFHGFTLAYSHANKVMHEQEKKIENTD